MGEQMNRKNRKTAAPTVTFVSTDEIARQARRSRWNRSGVIADPMLRTSEEYRADARRVAVKSCACEHCAAALDGAGDGTINHLPGADYHGMERIALTAVRGYWQEVAAPITAPAPRREKKLWYRPMEPVTLQSARAPKSGAPEYLTHAAALERVQRAVKRLCGGRGYWEREDAISYMTARILNAVKEDTAPRRHGTAREVIAYMDHVWTLRHLHGADLPSVPSDLVTPLALSRLVADWSRREATHAAESIEAAQEAGANITLQEARPSGAPAEKIVAPTFPPAYAARACDDITTRLGVGTLGGIWEALYCLLRDVTTEDAAEELETTHAALRAKTSRGSKALREKIAPTPADLRRIMDWYRDEDGARSRKMPARILREGTNNGAAPIRPTSAEHARALCTAVTAPSIITAPIGAVHRGAAALQAN